MTRVFYECKDNEGSTVFTSSYCEAKKYKEYKTRYETVTTDSLEDALKPHTEKA